MRDYTRWREWWGYCQYCKRDIYLDEPFSHGLDKAWARTLKYYMGLKLDKPPEYREIRIPHTHPCGCYEETRLIVERNWEGKYVYNLQE